MPRRAAKTKIPDVPWAENNHHLIWLLLGELEKDANYKVLFGKKDSQENTSGESKTTVHKRIGESILPELFKLDPGTVGDRVKGKIDSLTKQYRKHAQTLRQTGGGLEGENGRDDTQDMDMTFRISGSGPDASTPADALNLWEKIEKAFPFFPRLHRIFASRPNVNPICVTVSCDHEEKVGDDHIFAKSWRRHDNLPQEQ